MRMLGGFFWVFANASGPAKQRNRLGRFQRANMDQYIHTTHHRDLCYLRGGWGWVGILISCITWSSLRRLGMRNVSFISCVNLSFSFRVFGLLGVSLVLGYAWNANADCYGSES